MALYRQPSQLCMNTVKTRMLFISRIRMNLMWIDHHKGIIEDSKTWGFVVPGLRRVGVGACALASDLLMGKVPAVVRCLSDYDVWNKESELGWDTVVAVQYALRSKMRLNVLIA